MPAAQPPGGELTMRTPVITFDCDGVLANFTKMLTAVVNARFGTEYTQDWPDYNASNFESAHIDAGFDMVLEEPHFWGLLESYPGTPFQKIGNRSEEPRLNSSHRCISYAVFCLKKKK